MSVLRRYLDIRQAYKLTNYLFSSIPRRSDPLYYKLLAYSNFL